MKSKNILPNKPSELLTLALNDLRIVEKDKRYKVDMSTWHEPVALENQCHVCLAGAVMASTMRTDIRSFAHVDENPNHNYLYAINAFRIGHISNGLRELGYRDSVFKDFRDIKVQNYHEDRRGFFKTLRALARRLKKKGL